MSWEWIILAVFTLAGPVMFRAFLPVRQEMTVRSGAVFVVQYSPLAQALRSAMKFAIFWLIAALLAALDHRLWLRLWIILPPLAIIVVHCVYTRKAGVHWRTGRPLPS